MGQRFKEDQIGSLSHGGGTITLTASRLTIGGQQYSVPQLQLTLPTLTANTRYMLYVVVNAGVFSLIQSTNVNSVGPVGYSSWKLVGAYYSNYLLAFASFADINSSIKEVSALIKDLASPTPSPGITNGVTSTVIMDNKITDTENAYNISNGQYTVVVPGYYDISACSRMSGTFPAQGNIFPAIHINGPQSIYTARSESGSSSGFAGNDVHVQGLFLNAGDVVTFTITPSSWTSLSFVSDAQAHWFSISGRAIFSRPLKDL